MPEKRLNYEEAAAYLHVPVRTLRVARSSGQLAAYKIGRRVEFNRHDLDEWLRSRRRVMTL